MQLVKIEDKEIRLNSRLTETAFGKNDYSSLITQTGILAKCDSYAEGKYHFSFKNWNFESVKSFELENFSERFVFYCGKSTGFSKKAKTLTEFLESENKDESFEAGFAIISLLTQAAKENVKLPLNGGGGILIELKGDKTSVLFLPENLFKYSVAGLPPADFASLYGNWLNQTIYDLPALCFFRGVIAYKILSDKFPYPNENQTERNADILDRNFLPMELTVNGIDKNLANEIDKSLKLNSNVVNIPGKKKKGKSSEDLTPSAEFPLELLYANKNQKTENKISEEEFAQKAEIYLKNKKSQVLLKRRIRRNSTKIIIGGVVAVFVVIVTLNFVRTRQEEYISKGMTSVQTVQTFLNGINEKDTLTLSNITKGHEAQKVVDSVSQIYVAGKQREVYSKDNGFGDWVSWLFFSKDAESMNKAGLYAISLPKIDGRPVELKNCAFMRNEKPEAVTQENGITLEDGAKSVHKAEYLLFHTEGEFNEIQMDSIVQIYTLTYKKNSWFITDIDFESEQLEFNSTAFKNDFLTALIRCDKNIVNAVEQLRISYDFLPSKEILEKEQARQNELLINPFANL